MGANELAYTDKLKALIDVSAGINLKFSDVDALMVYILEAAMRLIECESSSLLLAQKGGDSLRFAIALGPKGAEAKNIIVDKNSLAGWVAQNKKPLVISNANKDERFFDRVQNKTGYITNTMIALPMTNGDEFIGVIELINKTGGREFSSEDLDLMTILAKHAGIAYANAASYRDAKDTIFALNDNIKQGGEYHVFIAKSAVIADLARVADAAAKTTSSVLITGESGVGKELFAEQLHLRSPRSDKPFVRVNCAALSQSLLEDELFGHAKGAYTDASTCRKGRFEMADGGTLFLDEIGEIPLELQAKLLRAIQDKKFERVGSSETISVDVRIVCATNKDLELMVKEGKFRDDLFYRLNVVPLRIPPLRERRDDIKPLADYFLQKFSGETKKNFKGFSEDAKLVLYNYYWPGNVRELENSIERACVLGTPPFVTAQNLQISAEISGDANSSPAQKGFVPQSGQTLKDAMNDFKKFYVESVLRTTGGKQADVAKALGIQRTYLSRLLLELGIR
ncbi:MAG: sigma-54-dependent Fis family transcriptional regulator [Treponema sp.]|nr:sigma-54-dependent Fis family transcriptional regulator [Treponema sp.]